MSPEPMILKTYMLGPWGESLRFCHGDTGSIVFIDSTAHL